MLTTYVHPTKQEREVPALAIAMAAGEDAANRQMRAEGRTAWNDADWNLAADIVAKLTGDA